MTTTAAKIERPIRELPVEDMVNLHARLISNIHQKETEREIDPGYRNEIKRRVAGVRAGRAKGVNALKALRKM
jgi:hypothetical protein